MALYQSDVTRFMREFFEQHPEEKQNQLEGHLRLWNKKPLDMEERRRLDESAVKQKPYPYQTEDK